MSVRGRDYSKWQDVVDWDGEKGQGLSFAFIKATEGALAPGTSDQDAISQFGLDPQFRRNWSEARRVGIQRGAYHFARPDLGNTPEMEAAWFCSVVNIHTLQPGDMLACDGEMGSGDLSGWFARWLGYVYQAAGYPPLDYGSPNFLATRRISFSALHGSYGLWLALWPLGATPDTPIPAPVEGWPVTAFWQYGSGGNVSGSGARVDGDVFNGDLDQLTRYGKPAPPEPPPPPKPPPQFVVTFQILAFQPDASVSVGGQWVPDTDELADLHPPDGAMTDSDAKYLCEAWIKDVAPTGKAYGYACAAYSAEGHMLIAESHTFGSSAVQP